LPILKDQKDKISELEELRNAVSASENPFEADELKIKLEEKENEVNYNRVAVQETALVAMDTQTTELQPILPDIKKTKPTDSKTANFNSSKDSQSKKIEVSMTRFSVRRPGSKKSES
jgi:hypothetical protein